MKTMFGVEENTAAGLCYVFGWVSGIVVLVIEKENKLVRFHALQSTLWFLMLMVVGWVLSFARNLFSAIPLVGWLPVGVFGLIYSIIGLVGLISWIALMVKAFGGSKIKMPIIGDVAWAQVNK